MEKGEKLLYANETTIWAYSKEDLEEIVNQQCDQLSSHEMKTSIIKTEGMWVSKYATGKLDKEIKGIQLNQTHQVECFGGWITEDREFEREIQSSLGNARRA